MHIHITMNEKDLHMKRLTALALMLALALMGLTARAEDAEPELDAAFPEGGEAAVEWEEDGLIVEGAAEDADLSIDGEMLLLDLDGEGVEDVAAEAADGADPLALSPESAEGAVRLVSNAAAVAIDEAAFPDGKFRAYVAAELDGDGDGALSAAEIDGVTGLDVTGMGIRALRGVDRFANLRRLVCRDNRLTALDLSGCKALECLDCSDNRLKKLEVGKCAALEELVCANNKLTRLELKDNRKLARLDCRGNDISTVDINKLSRKLSDLVKKNTHGNWFRGTLSWSNGEGDWLRLPGLVTVKRGKKTIHSKKELWHSMHMNPHREDYPELDDWGYANFRNVATTGMGRHVLYRSSHPLLKKFNRHREILAAMESVGVRTVINMFESEASVKSNPIYTGSYYATTNLWAKGMSMTMNKPAFMKDVASLCRFMIDHEGPYLLHCMGGRDRTGRVCAVLECLMGASSKEVIEDYMRTYRNYNGLEPGTWEYDYILKTQLKKSLKSVGINLSGRKGSLVKSAEKYLRNCGLKPKEIEALKARLATDY